MFYFVHQMQLMRFDEIVVAPYTKSRKLDALTLVKHTHTIIAQYPLSRKFLCRIVKYKMFICMYLQRINNMHRKIRTFPLLRYMQSLFK